MELSGGCKYIVSDQLDPEWLRSALFPLVRQEEDHIRNCRRNMNPLSGMRMFCLYSGEQAGWLEQAMDALGGEAIPKMAIPDEILGSVGRGDFSRLLSCENWLDSRGNVVVVSDDKSAKAVVEAIATPAINACIMKWLLQEYKEQESPGSTLLERRIALGRALLRIIFCA